MEDQIIMAKYKFDIIRRGTIIVDGMDSLEDAQEYIENCSPIDDITWSDFLETFSGEEIET